MSEERESGRPVALVGCGTIARAHAKAIAAEPELRLSALVDSDRVALARAEQELEAPGFDSVDGLLADGTVDLACVCTPPASHRPLAERLLHGGVDVLCEKPLSITVADARAMIRTAEAEERRLAVSDKFRHVSDLQQAGRLLRDGAIGAPVSFAVTFCAPVDVRHRWPSKPDLSGGGVLMDNGPHAFDVLSHVLDDPVEHVAAIFGRPVLAPPVEDSVVLTFRTASGQLGRIELSWLYYTRDLDYLVVQGSEGTLCVGWTGGRLRRHGVRQWTRFGSGYDKLEAFRGLWRSVSSDTPGRRPPSAVEALELIGRAYRSADS